VNVVALVARPSVEPRYVEVVANATDSIFGDLYIRSEHFEVLFNETLVGYVKQVL
jgi:hypothetical protein